MPNKYLLLGIFIITLLLLPKKSTSKKINPVVAEISQTPQETSSNIIVDVSGGVKKPGVYNLKKGARVLDALSAAQGLSDLADPEFVQLSLNLAESVSDGKKIYIPRYIDYLNKEECVNPNIGGIGSISSISNDLYLTLPLDSKSTQSSAHPINVNTTDLPTLDTLPGVGQAYADSIINNRPYSDYASFLDKSGLPKKLCDSLKNLISY